METILISTNTERPPCLIHNLIKWEKWLSIMCVPSPAFTVIQHWSAQSTWIHLCSRAFHTPSTHHLVTLALITDSFLPFAAPRPESPPTPTPAHVHFTQWQNCDSSGVQTLHDIKYRAAWLLDATAVRELKILRAWGNVVSFGRLAPTFLSPASRSWTEGFSLSREGRLGPPSPGPTPRPAGWIPVAPGRWSQWAAHRKRRRPAGSSSSTLRGPGRRTTPASPVHVLTEWSVIFLICNNAGFWGRWGEKWYLCNKRRNEGADSGHPAARPKA